MTDSSKRSSETPAGDKKPYHAPELHVHGELREITRGTGGQVYNASDSPDEYTSN